MIRFARILHRQTSTTTTTTHTEHYYGLSTFEGEGVSAVNKECRGGDRDGTRTTTDQTTMIGQSFTYRSNLPVEHVAEAGPYLRC